MAVEGQPYVGPRPFERRDEGIFFGRTREADDLTSLVIAHPIVLLYSQSGAGKTSLLNAKLFPSLERERFEVWPPARVKGFIPRDLAVANVYMFNALASWSQVESEHDLRGLASTTLSDVMRSGPI
jgi:hypothetical protein